MLDVVVRVDELVLLTAIPVVVVEADGGEVGEDEVEDDVAGVDAIVFCNAVTTGLDTMSSMSSWRLTVGGCTSANRVRRVMRLSATSNRLTRSSYGVLLMIVSCSHSKQLRLNR